MPGKRYRPEQIRRAKRDKHTLEQKGFIQIKRRQNGQSNSYKLGPEVSTLSTPLSTLCTRGVPQSGTEAYHFVGHNQKDQLNQTHIYNPSDSESFKRMNKTGHYVKQQPRYNRDFASQQSSIGTVIQM